MNTDNNEPRCRMAHDDDLVSKYLSDELLPEEAEAFEEHYFKCDACWQELETALAVRASITSTEQLGQRRTRSTVPVRWMQYAASVAFLAAGLAAIGYMSGLDVPFLARNEQSTPVDVPHNGVRERLVAELLPQVGQLDELSPVHFVPTRQNGEQAVVLARWPAVPQAEAYILKLHAADGTVVYEQTIRATSLPVTVDSLLQAALDAEVSGAVFGTIYAVRMETSDTTGSAYRLVAQSPPVRIMVLPENPE